MELIVGTNCYTDVAQATELINTYFQSSDPIRKYWNDIAEDSDKAAIILRNTMLYDNDGMRYKGYKQSISQPLQYPRINNKNQVIDVPLEVKIGILIQGIKSDMSNNYDEYKELKAQGIKNYKIKDASVEFFEHIDEKDIDTAKIENGMFISVFKQYFEENTITAG